MPLDAEFLVRLDRNSFIAYAMHHYDHQRCTSIKEFRVDLLRFRSLNTLISKYLQGEQQLQTRLILNHLIILYNLFGDAATNMLFFKTHRSNWNVLATMLTYLSRMPGELPQYELKASDLQLDQALLQELNSL